MLGDYPKPFLPSHKFMDDERCLVIQTRWPDNNWVIPFNISWMAKTCTRSWMMCPCQNQDVPALIHLRGLCPSSVLRTKYPDKGLLYTPTQHPSKPRQTLFVGGMSSKIHFHQEKWRIEDTVHNATAETTASLEDYALGKQEWLITGDDINCQKKGENYSTFLKLTGCSVGEFTCDDGECVWIS